MADQPKVSLLLQLVDKITEPINGVRGQLTSFGNTLKGLGATIAATFSAAALFSFFKSSVTEGLKAEDSYRRLGQSIKNTGNNFDDLRPSIDRTVDSVQKLSNQTDDDLRNALTKLISTTGDVSGSMKNLGLVADVAAERSIDLNEAAVLVGKTMNGNLTPITKAYGVEVKSVAEGMTLLHDRTDGFAKLATEGMGGALKNLSIQWGELKEAVGLAIIGSDNAKDSTSLLAGKLIELQGYIKDNSESISGFVGALVGAVPGALSFGAKIIGVFKEVGDAARFVLFKAEELGGGIWKLVGSAIEALGFLHKGWGETGAKIKATAEEGLRELRNSYEVENKKVVGVAQGTQDALTSGVKAGGKDRVTLTKEELAERKKLQDAYAKTLIDIEQYSHETVLTLLDGFYLKYLQASDKFWTLVRKLQDDAVAAGKVGSKDYAEALHQLGLAQDALAKKFADAAIPTKNLENVTATLPPTLTRVKLSTDLVTTSQLENIAASNDQRLAIQRVADETVKWADKVLHLADALGISDDSLRASIDAIHQIDEGIHGVNDAISALQGAKNLGEGISGVMGAIGAASSIVKGIGGLIKGVFGGESESARRIRLALESNSTKIEALRDSIGDLNINLTGRQLSGTQGALKEFFATGGAGQKGWGDRLGQLLLGKGVNMSDLEEVAKTLQINIRPDGHLDPRALQQLMDAIGFVEPTQFRNDFKGQKEKLGHDATLFNMTPQEQAAALARLAGGSLGSGAIGRALSGADFSTGTGRAAALSAIQQLAKDLPGLGAADLGGLTGSDFLSVLEELKSLIEQANQNAADLGSGLGADVPSKKDTSDLATAIANAQKVLDKLTEEGANAAQIANAQAALDALLAQQKTDASTGTGTGTPSVAVGLSDLIDVQVTSRDLLRDIRDIVKEAATPWTPGPAAASLVAAPGNLTVTIEQIIIEGTDASAEDIGTAVAEKISIAQAKLYRNAQQSAGNVTRT